MSLLLSTLLTACLLVSSSAADTVRGYVVDPVGNSAVTDAEVSFSLLGESGSDEILRKTVDGEGRFEFSGPFLKQGLAFSLTAFYRDVPYPSSRLLVGEQKEVVLEVFEPTQDDGDIHVTTQYLFLTVQAGDLEVALLLDVDNKGERTFVGTEHGQERRVTEFPIPEGAFGLQSHSGGLVRADARRAFDTQPLPPGTSQIGFSFHVDADDFAGEYVHSTLYPTDALEVYVHPPDIHLHTPFVDRGTVSLPERDYHVYRLANLHAGQSVSIPLPLTRPMRWVLKWSGLGLCIVAAAAVALVSRRSWTATADKDEGVAEVIEPLDPGVGPDASRGELEQRRQVLLAQLAAVDRAGGRKSRKAGAQRHKRQRLMGQAVAVYELLAKAREG